MRSYPPEMRQGSGRHDNYAVAQKTDVKKALDEAFDQAIAAGNTRAKDLGRPFLADEFQNVVLPQGVGTLQDYIKANRRGRGTALSAADRKAIWPVIESARKALDSENRLTHSDVIAEARRLLDHGDIRLPYVHVVVDETQDLEPEGLRLVAFLAVVSGLRVRFPRGSMPGADSHVWECGA